MTIAEPISPSPFPKERERCKEQVQSQSLAIRLNNIIDTTLTYSSVSLKSKYCALALPPSGSQEGLFCLLPFHASLNWLCFSITFSNNSSLSKALIEGMIKSGA